MKISNSKKQLARIISENGGWISGNYAIQDKDDKCIWFMFKPEGRPRGRADWPGVKSNRISCDKVLPGWHQTILSRDEYFHLYPAPDADGWIEWKGGECPVDVGTIVDVKHRDGDIGIHCHAGMSSSEPDGEGHATAEDWFHLDEGGDIIAYRLHKPEQSKPEFCESVMRSIPEPTAKPSIEQLAAEYRNAKDYADRKRQEADDAKAGAEAKLADLVAAGKALGLVVSVATTEPELVITVKVGDEVECVKPNVKPSKYKGMVGTVLEVDDSSTPYLVDFGGEERIWCNEVKFIRRP